MKTDADIRLAAAEALCTRAYALMQQARRTNEMTDTWVRRLDTWHHEWQEVVPGGSAPWVLVLPEKPDLLDAPPWLPAISEQRVPTDWTISEWEGQELRNSWASADRALRQVLALAAAELRDLHGPDARRPHGHIDMGLANMAHRVAEACQALALLGGRVDGVVHRHGCTVRAEQEALEAAAD